MTVLVLGDQRTDRVGPLTARPPRQGAVVRRPPPHHPHERTLVFSAMRHFRERPRDGLHRGDV